MVIGAGPAGLTAAYELSREEKFNIVMLEAEQQVGGISKTVDYKGNKIDIGGHRFFSKSDWVLEWWQKFLPIDASNKSLNIKYQNGEKTFTPNSKVQPKNGEVFLVRRRKSRIYFNRHLFDYPLKLNLNTIIGIGIFRSVKIFVSLLYRKLFPIKEETSLEDFFINRFGNELYRTFFKDYTQKVWGKKCSEISAEWGRQRVKGLGLKKIITHYLTTLFYPQRQKLGNKKVEQTLIEYFLYPQKGPGQLWEKVAKACQENGVDIRLNHHLTKLDLQKGRISEVFFENKSSLSQHSLVVDYVISSMPVKNLVLSIDGVVPHSVLEVAKKLEYRDFIIVGLLLKDLNLKDKDGKLCDDNWLYIQEKYVEVGRVQLFHNWSPWMTADKNTFWIGAEYFCEEGDILWSMTDEALIKFALEELESIDILDTENILDATVVRMPKAYPSYVGIYRDFPKVKEYINTIENLYPIGRNGTHKYNNQDHSMVTAREAVRNIKEGFRQKENIWKVNIEQLYHEKKHG